MVLVSIFYIERQQDHEPGLQILISIPIFIDGNVYINVQKKCCKYLRLCKVVMLNSKRLTDVFNFCDNRKM